MDYRIIAWHVHCRRVVGKEYEPVSRIDVHPAVTGATLVLLALALAGVLAGSGTLP